MSILRPKVLLQTTTGAAATGTWYFLDTKFEEAGTGRNIGGKLTTGDTVYIEASPDPYFDQFGLVASVSTIVTIASFTSVDFNTNIVGPWVQIRARKTGTAGVATVKGVV